MFDIQKFMAFINDPMSAHKAADLPINPDMLMSQLGVGLKPPSGSPELGLKMPVPGAPPDGVGFDVSGFGFNDIKAMNQPTFDPSKAMGIGAMGQSMMAQQQKQPALSPPAHQFVGGARQVKLNPYLTVPGRK